MAKSGVMEQMMVKVPDVFLSEIRKFCKEETDKSGQFYSVSKFFREAGLEKLSKIKAKRVERQG